MRLSPLLSRRALLLGLVLGLLAVGAVDAWHRLAPRQQPSPDPFALPPLSASSFLNTGPEARYVGIQVCAECHAGKHRTWQHTPHSRALSDLDPTAEPADARFFHTASGQACTVYRDRGQMHHRTAARDEQGEYVVEDHPLRYLVGSGHHTRSYLIEEDGFLSESPITWYASRKSWGMSPGYDRSRHRGFERAADGTCLFCHAGLLSAPETEYQRLRFTEQPIGCERCHGPGSLHVEEERAIRAGLKQAQERQPTIVNPSRLSRSRREAICAQCHLNADSAVILRGRSLSDFRPGLPLSDFCVNYRLDEPSSQMKVVGHVDQLHLSRCYQDSEKLTCTTCHDPHARTGPAEARQHSRKACLSCHGEAGCGLPPHQRLQRSPANDCLACHMPQVDTDIQHVAFTHHRIGIHTPSSPPPRGRTGPLAGLVALEEPSLSPLDRDRNLGLAYLSLAQRQANPDAAAAYQERALRLLRSVHARGLPDGEAAATLARLTRQADAPGALELTRTALRDPHLSPKGRVNSLFLIAEISLRTGQLEPALDALKQLTALRRLAQDWLLLGLCRQQSGDLSGALQALEKAAVIAPYRPDLRDQLAEVHERLRNADAARKERSTAQRLESQARQR